MWPHFSSTSLVEQRVFGFGSDSLGALIESNSIDALVVGLPFTSGTIVIPA
jgi:RNase H-fold protein (predicted Holliday junction resolvase)